MPLAHPGDFGLVTAMLQAKPDFGFRICHTPFPLNHQGTKNTEESQRDNNRYRYRDRYRYRCGRLRSEDPIPIAIGIAIPMERSAEHAVQYAHEANHYCDDDPFPDFDGNDVRWGSSDHNRRVPRSGRAHLGDCPSGVLGPRARKHGGGHTRGDRDRRRHGRDRRHLDRRRTGGGHPRRDPSAHHQRQRQRGRPQLRRDPQPRRRFVVRSSVCGREGSDPWRGGSCSMWRSKARRSTAASATRWRPP